MTKRSPSRRTLLKAGLAGLILPGQAFPQSQDREVEGGIGGTGIVGVLVGFGSLLVAGQRVETTGRTRFLNRFGRISEAQLNVGDSLTVEAGQNRAGQLIARRVHVDYPLVGQITAKSDNGRRMTINGVEVVSDSALGPNRIGERVAVSGLWEGRRVRASRVAPAPHGPDLMTGTVDWSGARASIGGVRVQRGGIGATVPEGFAAALGTYDTARGAFVARDVEPARFTGAAGPLRRLAVEGWLEPSAEAPGMRVAGLGHNFTRTLNLRGLTDQWLLLQGDYDGLFRVNTAQRLPNAQSSRGRVLRDLGNR